VSIKKKVIVIDDSAFMRRALSDIINSFSGFEVVSVAMDGIDGLKKIDKFKPDVVTLDVSMPNMDGLHMLDELMNKNPIPVIVVSSYTKKGSIEALRALELGAVDFVEKPSGPISLDIDKVKDELFKKLNVAIKSNISNSGYHKIDRLLDDVTTMPISSELVVAIASSTGGPIALVDIFARFPENFPCPIIVVQHMPPMFTASLSDRLNKLSFIEVKEAQEGDILEKGKAYLAPGGYHMKIVYNSKIMKNVVKLYKSDRIEGVIPSANPMFDSVSDLYGSNVVAVILTGMGKDGVDGLKKISEKGGKIIAQDEKSCVVFGMPKSAIEANVVDYVMPLQDITEKVVELVLIG
jgi:two-component system, chemotaxis family, protein-glutamate methylesterase/glutaminase